MTYVRKHPAAFYDTTRVYAKATSSSVHFLIAENERMAKELQVAKQGGDLVTISARAEVKKEILDELLSLDTIMQSLYSKFGTVHKVVIHLNGWQQRCDRRALIMLKIHVVFDDMQAWTMKYKGAPLHLPKMMRPNAIELKARLQSEI